MPRGFLDSSPNTSVARLLIRLLHFNIAQRDAIDGARWQPIGDMIDNAFIDQ
jgi:hypothetical protein